MCKIRRPAIGLNFISIRLANKGAVMHKVLSILLVVALVSASCASTGKAAAKLEPGMTKQQVLDLLGSPADRSFRGSDEAWQYQEIAGFGQCKYTTVWISNGKLVGISSRRGGSVAGCGLGSQEVNWNDMPSAGQGSQG
jgi:SmpA / OmlA family